MQITFTAGELLDRFIWDEVCKLKGLSVWCVNEGQMQPEEKISFTEEEAIKLRLIPEPLPYSPWQRRG